MKKNLLAFIACLTFAGLSAQYIKTSTSAPKIGDINSQILDTLPQIDKGGSGPFQVWDFSDFDFDETFDEKYDDPSMSSAASEFPEADVIQSNGFETKFFDITPTGMNWIGVSVPNFTTAEEMAAPLNPEEVMFEFPSSYGTAFTNNSSYKVTFAFDSTVGGFDIDSLRITYISQKLVEWDAFGQLTTPYGIFPNTTRERLYQEIEYKLEACVNIGITCIFQDVTEVSGFGGKDTAVVYSWYGPESSFPIASLAYMANDQDIWYASINSSVESGIAEYKASGGLLYPNPAKDNFSLKNKDAEEITITDITGKIVKKENVKTDKSIDVSDLKIGNYFVTIITSDGVLNEKLSIQR